MIIELCYTTDDNEVVNKKVSKVNTVNATIKENSSVINPVLILSTFDIKKINYIHIAEWARYYYITDIIALDASHLEVHCKVDVLKSFANGIANSNAIINKQQYDEKSSKYIDDGSYVTECKEVTQYLTFNKVFNTHWYNLIACGGN